MPVAVAEAAERSAYGQFPEQIERDWLGRWCHLSEADVSLARRRSGEVTRLGFAALEALLVVADGKRRSDLDRLRRPPFSPTIAGLVQALERLGEIRALGVGGLDLSGVPSRRAAAWPATRKTRGPPSWLTWRSPSCTCSPPAPETTSSTSSTSSSATSSARPPAGASAAAPQSCGTTTAPCEDLALDTGPARVVAHLGQALDSAWRRTADGMAANPDLRIEQRDGADRIVVTPLDAVDEPTSLVELRAMVEALLPEVEIADLPLEVHGWTGFLDEYTHISGAASRAEGLVESLSALLVSEACNVGLAPVVDEDYPPLTRDRLNWAAHNYFRSATHSAASTRLFDYHADLDLARDAWGGGEMASADRMRFVIPVATIHAGYNPRYFGRQRGSTLYTWMADTHASFHQTLIPGTQRDSLYALDGLIANQTVLRPDTVSTDTAGASEIVFALAWALGYRYGPRLADLADHRLWVIDARAHYGPLQGLARNRANTSLIAGQWDQICRLAASLEARTVTASAILRSLQRGPNPSSLGRALAELGRIVKTCMSSTTATTRSTAAPSTASSAGARPSATRPSTSTAATAPQAGRPAAGCDPSARRRHRSASPRRRQEGPQPLSRT